LYFWSDMSYYQSNNWSYKMHCSCRYKLNTRTCNSNPNFSWKWIGCSERDYIFMELYNSVINSGSSDSCWKLHFFKFKNVVHQNVGIYKKSIQVSFDCNWIKIALTQRNFEKIKWQLDWYYRKDRSTKKIKKGSHQSKLSSFECGRAQIPRKTAVKWLLNHIRD